MEMNGSSRYTLRRAGDANCSSNGEGCGVGAAALGAQDPEEETGPTGTTQINATHLAVVSVRCRVICRPTRRQNLTREPPSPRTEVSSVVFPFKGRTSISQVMFFVTDSLLSI